MKVIPKRSVSAGQRFEIQIRFEDDRIISVVWKPGVKEN